jgi:hypothetical protein
VSDSGSQTGLLDGTTRDCFSLEVTTSIDPEARYEPRSA